MTAIKAMVRNGRVETEHPLEFPDGTEVLVVHSEDVFEPEQDNSPEGIQAWLKWYDSLEPLILTKEDERVVEAARKERKEWDLVHADERAEKLRKLCE